jgi:quaternary ammonium compound-resistance protein SugE
MIAWGILVISSFFELAFTVFMKLSDGFKNKKYTVLTVISTVIGIGLLSIATKTLPLGIAYAVWTGLGTLFTVTFGIVVFKENRDWKRIFCLSLIIIGVVGLRLSSLDF